jgi:class 3 adenylate cyclase
MFTDIVGYTALMGNNEEKAFALLKTNRELQKPVIESFNGRFIKELGDGIMASFNTVSDSVNAALKNPGNCKAINEYGCVSAFTWAKCCLKMMMYLEMA